MRYLSVILAFILPVAFSSCHPDNQNNYAISDFKKSLQPYLTEVVSKGIVTYDTATSFIQTHATDNELNQLSHSEHPVLRAIAFRTMLERPTFDHFELIMNNLDDTAIVVIDGGEFGIMHLRIADDILENGRWKDTVAKNKTIEEVILKHNYLRGAYIKADEVAPKEIFYPHIKEMVLRKTELEIIKETGDSRSMDFYPIDFYAVEFALYALAKYKKENDVDLIKQRLLANAWRLSPPSFKLMMDYPNETYLDVYERFYRYTLYEELCHKQNSSIATDFINSVASYKNERSAKILNGILNAFPLTGCRADTASLKNELADAIRKNKCTAYASILSRVEITVKEYQKNEMFLDKDLIEFPADTSLEPIRWYKTYK